MNSTNIAIIGGGIAGLVLALTLHKQGVKCTIYELRQTADISNPGAIGLAPNALRALDKLGLYENLHNVSWPLRQMRFYNELDHCAAAIDIGGIEHYGYDTLRIVRRRLHDVLLEAIQSAGIDIVSGKKFSHIVSTTSSTITFAFTDDTTVTSSILVGADGIHSTVRKHIYPNIQPEYKGSLTMAAKLDHNPLFSIPQTPDVSSRVNSISITNGKSAAFIVIAQSKDGNELSLGLDRPYPSQSREQWDALLNDKQKQYDVFMEDYNAWPATIQVMMREVKVENMYRSWPFYAIPDLEHWSAEDAKVILIGDAAHAIPPSAGQGACMAVEDAWSLGLVLGSYYTQIGTDGFSSRILEWQGRRRERVDKMRTLTKQMGNARLPKEMRETLPVGEYFATGEEKDLSWVYGYDYQI